MRNPRLAALFFALASLAWLAVAVMLPSFRLAYGALSIINVGLAVFYLRRHRSGQA